METLEIPTGKATRQRIEPKRRTAKESFSIGIFDLGFLESFIEEGLARTLKFTTEDEKKQGLELAWALLETCEKRWGEGAEQTNWPLVKIGEFYTGVERIHFFNRAFLVATPAGHYSNSQIATWIANECEKLERHDVAERWHLRAVKDARKGQREFQLREALMCASDFFKTRDPKKASRFAAEAAVHKHPAARVV